MTAVRSGPASAVGALLFAAIGTVIVTVSLPASPPGSVTVRVKVREASLSRPEGAVKVGFAVFAAVRVTSGEPPVWDQAYVSVCFSRS